MNEYKTRKYALLFFCLYLVSQAVIIILLQPISGGSLLKLQMIFSADSFKSIIQGWENAGMLKNYYLHFIPDFAHPVWYGFFLYFLIRLVFSAAAKKGMFVKAKAVKNLLLYAGPAAAAFDLLENAFHLVLLQTRVLITPLTVFILSLMSLLKWLLSGGALLSAGVVFILVLLRGKKVGAAE